MSFDTQTLVNRAAAGLARRFSRRSFLVRSAVVGSALATSGFDYVLHPESAYASVCGSGASCGDGWTAMCCTIHKGVNQCPPGSFAGGWWKADGASLCGGSARYYIDCQAECHCGEGSAFCRESCWDCRPHCADGSCDKRRVCHNVFRYGQCDRNRRSSGPVMCRTISCTPPWEWLNCSSASATDQATVTHSASCLSTWGPILERYTAMGSQGSVLGASVGPQKKDGNGTLQVYLGGRMWDSRKTGAHWLTGHIEHKYVTLARARERLGFPTTDVTPQGNHQYAEFQTGTITHASGANSANAIWGRINHHWQQLDAWRGPVGWPTSDVRTSAGHDYAEFGSGTIVHASGTNDAIAVWGAVNTKWRALDAQNGQLGWPTSGMQPEGSGYVAHFAKGDIATSEGTGTHWLVGPIDAAWRRNGGAGGELGFPTTDIYTNADNDREADFVGGTITYDPETGKVTVTPKSG